MIALSLCHDKNMKVTSDGKAEGTQCPHHIPTTRTDAFLPSTSTSSAHSQFLVGKPWGIDYHPHSPLLQAARDRWATAARLRAAAHTDYWQPQRCPESTSPTPKSTLSSRAATSKFSVQAALLSFKENLEIKAAVSQEDSQVCLPLKGGGQTQWKTKRTENSWENIFTLVSSQGISQKLHKLSSKIPFSQSQGNIFVLFQHK